MSALLFLTIVSSPEEARAARLLIDSLRTFGGELADSPFWVFAPHLEPARALEDEHTRLLPLAAPDPVLAYPFGTKVAACARAEELSPAGTRSLVCVDTSCLIVRPPVLFDLGADFDAALRPVHVRNVGLPPSEPLDAFWKGIYASVRQQFGFDLARRFIHTQVQLSPGATFAVPMLTYLPFTFSIHLQPRAVKHCMDRPFFARRQCHLQRLGVPVQGRIIQNGQCHPQQLAQILFGCVFWTCPYFTMIRLSCNNAFCK